MATNRRAEGDDDLLEVRRAAVLVNRHPETVRRWVWSGRLPARRSGHRLLVARADLEALVRQDALVPTIAEWADRAAATRDRSSQTASGRSAADLVIEDRRERSRTARTNAGR
jgi:excisionase family DNA binding protein